jgi:microcompartment protein CcmK/EutM
MVNHLKLLLTLYINNNHHNHSFLHRMINYISSCIGDSVLLSIVTGSSIQNSLQHSPQQTNANTAITTRIIKIITTNIIIIIRIMSLLYFYQFIY